MSSDTSYPKNHISYQLHIRVHKNIRIVAGALGQCNFSAGHYIYTGSAKRNMDTRIKRHLSDEKKLRWHIDYLLIHPDVEVTSVDTFEKEECLLNQQVDGEIPAPGFGASDCRRHCGAHLKYLFGK
jgi:Uri superfamily endonuclease